MILNQTFRLTGFERMLDYTNMVVNGDYKKVKVNVESEIVLDNFDYTITDHMQEHKIIGLDNGVYKLVNQTNDSRYIYAHIQNDTIVNILFDNYQVENIEEILNFEKFKEQVLWNRAFSYVLDHKELSESLHNDEIDYDDIAKFEEVYNSVEWEEEVDRWYDDEYFEVSSLGYCI